MDSDDLWGDLPDAETRVPVRLLADQADILGQKTGNILEARVIPISFSSDNLAYELEIFAPVLDNYSITILRIRHSIESYPVQVESIVGEKARYEASNEAEFLDILRHILGSNETRRIIASLIGQSNVTVRPI